eukprot:jgi/Botrbrau1/18862/Bobra.177_2s0022.1
MACEGGARGGAERVSVGRGLLEEGCVAYVGRGRHVCAGFVFAELKHTADVLLRDSITCFRTTCGCKVGKTWGAVWSWVWLLTVCWCFFIS